MKHYVAGFMFDSLRQRVALIRKIKPEWQRGKLNGIGGKVEAWDEDSTCAMRREFFEETGHATNTYEWLPFASMNGDDSGGWRVDFFAAHGDLSKLRTIEDEPIEIVSLSDISLTRSDMIENLPWLIALAMDYLTDGRPSFVEAIYRKLGA